MERISRRNIKSWTILLGVLVLGIAQVEAGTNGKIRVGSTFNSTDSTGRYRMTGSIGGQVWRSNGAARVSAIRAPQEAAKAKPAAASDLAAAHAYPVPFKPSDGHTSITFTNLTSKATIRIYTISGELVKTLNKDDGSNDLVWSPVANESGEGLASGVYLFLIDSSGSSRKSGKLMVIK